MADVVTGGASRHATDTLNSWINTSLEAYHAVLTDEGPPQRATRTTLTTSASTTVADGYPANERVVLPTDFAELLEVYVEHGSTRRPIRPFGGIDVALGTEDYWPTESVQPSIPERYEVTRSSAGAAVLRLLPPCDGVYTIGIHYVPTFTALTADSSTYPFLDGTSDAVVCDVALKILERDGAQEAAQYRAIRDRRDAALMVLRRKARRMNRAGPHAMIDVRGRTRRARGGYLA